jgi:hypothetical protein
LGSKILTAQIADWNNFIDRKNFVETNICA